MLVVNPSKIVKHVIGDDETGKAIFHCRVLNNREAIELQADVKTAIDGEEENEEARNYSRVVELLRRKVVEVEGLVDQDGEPWEVPKDSNGLISLEFWDNLPFQPILSELFQVITRSAGLTVEEVKN